MSCATSISHAVSEHIPAVMQLMCVSSGKFVTLGMLTTKCLNTAMMMIFILTGVAGVKDAGTCSTDKVKRKRLAQIQRTVNNDSSQPYWTPAMALRDDVLNSTVPTLFYVMLTHNPLVKPEDVDSHPTTYSDDEKKSEDGVMFPGHVFVIESSGDGKYSLFQSYIGQYDLKDHLKFPQYLDMSKARMTELLDGLISMLHRATWTPATTAFWSELTHSDPVESKKFEGYSIMERVLLCHREFPATECAKVLLDTIGATLAEIGDVDSSRDGEVYGNAEMFDVKDELRSYAVAPLTRGEMRTQLYTIKSNIESFKRNDSSSSLVMGGSSSSSGSSDVFGDIERAIKARGAKKGGVTILVHSPGCGFCRDLLPEWRKAVSKLAAKGEKVFDIEVDQLRGSDSTIAKTIRDDPGFAGVPHIISLKDATTVRARYTGDRSASSLVKFGCSKR